MKKRSKNGNELWTMASKTKTVRSTQKKKKRDKTREGRKIEIQKMR